MQSKNIPFVFIALSALAYVVFFQNCSSNTNFGTTSSASTETPAANSPTEVVPGSTLNLRITHINGNRDFLINVTGLSITDSQCKLQYQKDGTTWTDFSNDFLCNSDTGSVKLLLPTQDNWTNNFNTTSGGVSVRIVKSKDKSIVGTFTEKLRCANQNPASSQTPNIDENCNGRWDDFVNGQEIPCDVASNALIFNSTYSCAPTTTCDGKTAQFKKHKWLFASGLYSQADCDYRSHMPNVSGPSMQKESTDLSGIVPDHPFVTSNPTFCEGSSGYNTVTQSTVDGYAVYLSQWMSSHCSYAYFQTVSYY